MWQLHPLSVARRRGEIETQELAAGQPDAALGEMPEAEFRALQVGQRGQRPIDRRLGVAHRLQGAGVVGVRPVAEVQPEDVDADPRQFQHLFGRAAGGAERGDDAGAALADHGGVP